jgi:hypothetical protein
MQNNVKHVHTANLSYTKFYNLFFPINSNMVCILANTLKIHRVPNQNRIPLYAVSPITLFLTRPKES